MGVVYEARQVPLKRRVALKVLPPGLGLTDQAVQRFEREAQAAARLHHNNIVPVYATGHDEGCHFYAMELVEGQGTRGGSPAVFSSRGGAARGDLSRRRCRAKGIPRGR